MKNKRVIHWFKRDLRLSDNPALVKAAQFGDVIPLFILDADSSVKMGAASQWWLHHSLQALNLDLNGALNVVSGDPTVIIPKLAQEYGCSLVTWNRGYDPFQIDQERHLKDCLTRSKLDCICENATLLWSPTDVLKKDGTPYRVFTPFYRNALSHAESPRYPLEKPDLNLVELGQYSQSIDSLDLLPKHSWPEKFSNRWSVGELAAKKRLDAFIRSGLSDYECGRDYPAKANLSQLSPHLHFGEISPNTVWHKVQDSGCSEGSACFMSQLGWREFAHNLLFHFPSMSEKNLQEKFDSFPWITDLVSLAAWQQGSTGYPIVDAGMRELWQTGFMHNRVRMIVGSFLVKNLMIDWRLGQDWFWDCLLDADLANNSMGWQWVSGCGVDAAPYFRIFNPVTQGHKFDPKGTYTRQYVPELSNLPQKYLFSPWEAPKAVLKDSGIILGEDYPLPIVDLKMSRERALASYKTL